MTYNLRPEIGKNFCYAPWTNIHINTSGSYKTCCAGTEIIGDLRTVPITKLLANQKLIEIKSSILNNQTHPNCQICYRQETHSSVSERSWYHDIAEQKQIHIDALEQTKLQNLDIRWSNTCNLSCVYCDHEASSQWAALKKLPMDRLDYSDTLQSILDLIDSNKDTLKNLALLGGEPLLQKENVALLDIVPDHVHINVITNLSVPLQNNKIFQKLVNRKNVMWDISFETVEDRFEYVRHGSKWQTIIDNIRHLNDVAKNNPGQLVGITSQYSVYNALSLEYIHEYFADNSLPMMRWNELHYPDILSVSNLPQRFIDKAIVELKNSVKYHYAPVQEQFLLDMAKSLSNIKPRNLDCASLYKWHELQENMYWPDCKLKFADLWPEYNLC